jgi:hypothetical protein
MQIKLGKEVQNQGKILQIPICMYLHLLTFSNYLKKKLVFEGWEINVYREKETDDSL